MESSIWITLPSSEGPSSNEPGSFTTKLSKPIRLVGRYELGLKQISYSKKWHNVLDGQNTFYIRTGTNVYGIKLAPGYYSTPAYLVDELNSLIKVSLGKPREGRDQAVIFGFSIHTHKLKISLAQDTSFIVSAMSDLSKLMGLLSDNIKSAAFVIYDSRVGYAEIVGDDVKNALLSRTAAAIELNENVADTMNKFERIANNEDLKVLSDSAAYVVKIVSKLLKEQKLAGTALAGQSMLLQSEVSMENIPRLYVYSSNIDYVPIGSGEAPLLRIIRTSGQHGDSVQETFDSVIYVPIFSTDIDKISINICDEHGRVVRFGGETVVVLEARKL